MTPKELLISAWKLIEDSNNRCTKVFARDVNGYSVLPRSNKAVCFCSIGALYAADVLKDYNFGYVHSKEFFIAKNCLTTAAKEVFDISDIVVINDTDIINNPPLLYSKAIEIASYIV